MLKIKTLIAFLFSLCLSLLLSNAQSYIADSIIVNFPNKDSLQFQHSLIVEDHRSENPNFLSVNEKKKWLVFPVDQIVIASKPVSEGLMNYQNDSSPEKYLLGIHEFYIQQSLSLFNRSYKLNACLELSHLSTSDKSLSGTFYYEQTIKMKKKIQDSIAYTEALDFYSKQIISDLNFVSSDTTKVEEFGEYHFRRGANAFRKNLYLPVEIFFGLNFFGFDAEVYFSAPEPSQKFERKSRLFRYLNFENRESVAFSGNISLLNYRISERLLLQNKSAYFLGFNKWHDIDEAKRTFEEVFLFQLTARQAIYYNPLDKNGFIFGMGLMEEASYIIYNEPIFHIGLSFSLGYKF